MRATSARSSAQLRRRFTWSSPQNTRAVSAPSLRSRFSAKFRRALGKSAARHLALVDEKGRMPLSPNTLANSHSADQNSAGASIGSDASRRSRQTTCPLAMTSRLRRQPVSFERRGFFQVSTEARAWSVLGWAVCLALFVAARYEGR